MFPLWSLKISIFAARIVYPLWMSLEAIVAKDSKKMRSWLIFWIVSQALGVMFRFSDCFYHLLENYVPALYYETKLAAYIILVDPNGRAVEWIEMHIADYWNHSGRAELEKLHKIVEPYAGHVLCVLKDKFAAAKSMKSSVLDTTVIETEKVVVPTEVSADENNSNRVVNSEPIKTAVTTTTTTATTTTTSNEDTAGEAPVTVNSEN